MNTPRSRSPVFRAVVALAVLLAATAGLVWLGYRPGVARVDGGRDTAARPEPADVTVFVTRTGSKYHRAGCRYLKSSKEIPLGEAAERYEPCRVCDPPRP